MAFDGEGAAALGLRPRLVRLALLGLVAAAVAVAVQGLGALLSLALLVAPALAVRRRSTLGRPRDRGGRGRGRAGGAVGHLRVAPRGHGRRRVGGAHALPGGGAREPGYAAAGRSPAVRRVRMIAAPSAATPTLTS